MKYILEKTQTEVYQDFKRENPNIDIKQRYFETCKPFFVVPARIKDRNSCCCRKHVEIQMVFKRCMEYRRKFNSDNVYAHLSDMVDDSMCPLENDEDEHDMACINRSCTDCGTKKIVRIDHEKDVNDDMRIE